MVLFNKICGFEDLIILFLTTHVSCVLLYMLSKMLLVLIVFYKNYILQLLCI